MLKKTISILSLVFLLITGCILYYLAGEYSRSQLILILIAAVIAFFFFIINCNYSIRDSTSHSIRIAYIFLLGYFIVFFQRYLDLIAGLCSPNNSFLFNSSDTIIRTAALSFIGLIAFILGYISYKSYGNYAQKNIKIIETSTLKGLSLIFTIIFVALNGADFIAGSYSQASIESRQGTVAAYSQVICQAFYLATLTLEIYQNKPCLSFWQFLKQLGVRFNLALLIYVSLVLVSGDRGPIIQVGLMLIASYVIKVRPHVNLIAIIFICIIGAYALTLMGIARTQDKSDSFITRMELSSNHKIETYSAPSLIPITGELSNSVRCTHTAVANVPSRHPFFYGSFQLRDLCRIIPFSNALTSYIFDTDSRYQNSAMFITILRNGRFYTSGEGSTVVADLYLSFGMPGVLIGLFLFGRLVKHVETKVFFTPPAQIHFLYSSLALFLFSIAIYINRSGIFSSIASFSYGIIVIFIYVTLHRQRVSIKSHKL